MNKILPAFVIVCFSLSSACTTLQPVEASPEEVQRLITDEQILEPGMRVRLVTIDETVHEFRVSEVDVEQGLVIGEQAQVPIADVVAVDTREVSVGRTALLVGGLGYGILALLAIALAPALLLGG